MRVAPLVMTMKLTVIRITKTISADDEVAAHDEAGEAGDDVAGGVRSPRRRCDRIRRVVAMLSASRSIVAISSTVGKAEKSSGLWIHSATIRISTDSAIENASPMSIRNAGSGRNSTVRMKTMPSAKPTSCPLLRSTGLTLEATEAPSIAARMLAGALAWPVKLARGCSRATALLAASEPDLDAGVDLLGEGVDDRCR